MLLLCVLIEVETWSTRVCCNHGTDGNESNHYFEYPTITAVGFTIFMYEASADQDPELHLEAPNLQLKDQIHSSQVSPPPTPKFAALT